MIITGLTTSELRDVVRKLNAEDYDGNILVERTEALSATGTRISVKLGTVDSFEHGSRTSSSGRHGRWLCWHGFRDVIRGALAVNPEAVIRTGKTVYKGRQHFEDTYTNTADWNVGSMVQPAYMPDLCVGHCAGDWE